MDKDKKINQILINQTVIMNAISNLSHSKYGSIDRDNLLKEFNNTLILIAKKEIKK